MKIRNGFISNSSSASFCVASKFLTDEQKELLLSLDDHKKLKKEINERLGSDTLSTSENNYNKSKEYHEIYKQMIKDGRFYDEWETGEHKHRPTFEYISGSTNMDDGCLKELMKKIKIDITTIEFSRDHGTEKATHPEAIEFFIKLYKTWFNNLTEEDKKFHKEIYNEEINELSIYEREEENED